MALRTCEVGGEYRLVRDFEIRDLRTGTLKAFLRKGETVKVKKVEPETDQVWVEGVALSIPLATFLQTIVPA